MTASNFGSVINAKRVTPSLIKRLLGEYDISRVKAVAWGVTNEAEAIKTFTAKTHLEVVETGLWLDESGVLGASPDGLVGEDHVLEAKCSYTFRDASIEEALKSDTFCLEKKEDGSYSLKKESCLLAPSARANVLSQTKLLLLCCLDKSLVCNY